MHAQDIIDYVENHSKEEGDAYLDSLFKDGNFFKQETEFDDYGYPDKYVVKDKICLARPDALHFPYGGWDMDAILYEKGYYPKDNPEKEKTLNALEKINRNVRESFIQKFRNSGLDISGVEILLKICEYNNQHPESDIADRLLNAAHKNEVTWCDDIVKDKDNPYFYINTLCKHYGQKAFGTEETYSVSGNNFKQDFKAITKLYEYANDRTHDDAFSYFLLQPVRDSAREYLFEAIAQGKTSYDYKELKEFYDASPENKKWMITTGIDGSDNNAWGHEDTNVFETDAYKRALHRMEYDIFRGENKKIFEDTDFSKLSEKEKNLILEFTDHGYEAKAIVDSYKGNIEYNDLIAKHFSKDEFEKIVEDYKITYYRRENERLTEENKQIKAQAVEENKRLTEEHKVVEKARLRVEAKEKELSFIRDIDAVCKGEVAKFEPARLKEIFDEMKREVSKNPNMLEGYLTGMCKIYTSKTNTPEQKADYFKELHEVRKSGKNNAEKREMAHTFKRVLERNPELAKDEALKGLAKVDYGAVGIKPTERGFKKNSGEREA